MEVVTMEKKAFDLMMARYDALVKKVELLKHKANGKRLNKWLTGHEVCQQLRISQRTLQKLRDRRFLGHADRSPILLLPRRGQSHRSAYRQNQIGIA